METSYSYFNRDLSWLHFNHRVLNEARDKSLPLYERIKFLAIYSNNLEEFYRVRLSYYRNLIRELPEDDDKFQRVQPIKLIDEINGLVSQHQAEFSEIFNNEILPELRNNRIFLLRRKDKLNKSQQAFCKQVFVSNVLPSLQPVLLKKRRVKPFLKTGQVYVCIKFYRTGIPTWLQRAVYGIVKIPTDHDVARFIELPEEKGNYYIMFLEDLVMRNIKSIFPGYTVSDWYNIKVTRDADLEYDDYVGEDLIDVIERIGSARELGHPNRFQFDYKMPAGMIEFLKATFNLEDRDLVKGGAIHNFRDFFNFPNPMAPRLENEKIIPLRVKELDDVDSLINEFTKKEYMLHFPYQTYNYFIRYLQEAANDPNVSEIKATQYRVAANSAVVDALITAAENGKKVTVFVELKARFDEEANLRHARDMKQAGIKIIYSIPGLKVHAKVALVIRQKSDGTDQSVAYMATGNFNERTARLYCDHGFFTSEKKIIDELKSMFIYLEDQRFRPHFKHILVPNFNMVERFSEMIDQEIEHVKNGGEGYICLKMNGLEDPAMVDMLYRASEHGVKIDVIVRGICILVPNQKYSKNIRLIRIIDRFLEHDRVFVFGNNGKEIVYTGSADWMRRNLYRRIECVFPVTNKKIKKELIDLLNIELNDNVKARLIGDDMLNKRIKRSGQAIRSQVEIYNYLKQKEDAKKLDKE
ncbi:polyphosphate kinase 1 [Saccharicrinis sp. FJH2]|uniref:polyphosphate kinase 1 n=1 Tax=Saccharicrinis sp. FJH65 TaxID=3344659 RepID=UPI0035F29CE7